MYKNIIISLIIAIFAGCSAPKPDTKPNWYLVPPKDFNNFYAVGSGADISGAKNRAIASLRENFTTELNSEFKKQNHILDDALLTEIFKSNEYISMKLSFKNIKVEKSTKFQGETLILISIPRVGIFEQLKRMSDMKFQNVEDAYKKSENDIAIKKYIVLKPLLEEYPSLASYAAFKEYSISTYRADKEFYFLKNLRQELKELKEKISFYVLSDANSIAFTNSIKSAIKSEGLTVQSTPLSHASLKLIITSTTTDTQDYSFNKSSNLVKYNTYDINKNEVAFRQHTFIGKSRKSYSDGKRQSAVQAASKINKLGIFDFIGLKTK